MEKGIKKTGMWVWKGNRSFEQVYLNGVFGYLENGVFLDLESFNEV